MDKDLVWERIRITHPEIKRENFPIDDPYYFQEIVVNNCNHYAAKSGDLVMDIGANIGIFSVLCALNGAEVVAYEPHREAFEVLRETLRRNYVLGSVLAYNEAVQVHSGTCKYLGSTSRPGNHQPDRTWTSFNGNVRDGENTTPCIGFDDAVMNHEWDCVKMDIEGGEFEILMAASDGALRKIKYLTLELHNNWVDKVGHDALVSRLEKIFTIDGIKEGDPAFAGQDRYSSIFATRR